MANEYVDMIRPHDMFRRNGPYWEVSQTQRYDGPYVRLLKSDDDGFCFRVRIPPGLTMGTGLTLQLQVVDDGVDAGDLGKVVRIAATAKLLASGTDTEDIASGGATETAVDVTLDATAGEVVLANLAMANAVLDGAAVGGRVLFRIRRLGTHANDTCPGIVLLGDISIINT